MNLKLAVGIALVFLTTVRAADAQWVTSAAVGVTVGGAAEQVYPRGSLSVGRWNGPWALDLEAGVVPLFFESEPGDEVEMVLTVIPKVIIALHEPTAALTPFVSVGLGLMTYALTDSADRFEQGRTHAAFSLGTGVLKSLTDRWGLRADVQYVRGLGDVNPPAGFAWGRETMHFWTPSVGLVVRF